MANFCPQCGGKIEAGQTKCSFCGKDLSSLMTGDSTMQYGSQNNSQSDSQNSGSNQYESQDTNLQYGNQGSTANQYTSQNTVNQYSVQGANNQYGQSTANQYTGQGGGNSYSYYQDNTSGYTTYQSPMPPTVPQPQSANGLQITGLVLGIISIVICCCPGGGIVLAIAGLVCSIVGNQQNKHGVGMAGLICSIIGIVLGVLMILLNFLGEGLVDYFTY